MTQTQPLRELFDRLKALDVLDQHVRRLETELDKGPKAVAEQTAQVAALTAQIKSFEDKTKVLKAQIRMRENDLKAHEAKIAKLKDQSGQVKNNKEFMAFRAEIANAQAEADRLQGEVLKILDVVQQAEKKVVELGQQRAQAQVKLDAAKAHMDGLLANVKAERDHLLGERPAKLQGIPPETLDLYERARRSRGDALARVEVEYCSGCQERLTRNDIYAVENVTRVVSCKGCNRILCVP
jgi:predicted  nucleic acid-binding Zn-ribbon protein